MSHYQHLTIYEREEIHVLIEQNLSIQKIAKILKRDLSTISREIKKIKLETPIHLQDPRETMNEIKRKVVGSDFCKIRK